MKWKSQRELAKEFGVGKTQIQNILKRKADLLKEISSNEPLDKKRKTKDTFITPVNDLVHKWQKKRI